MEDFIPLFHRTMVEHNISGSSLYNAAQTSLFYRQLPSTVQQRKTAKQHVPTNDRISLMVCTAADGTKVPLAAVGKAKSPFIDSESDEEDEGGKTSGVNRKDEQGGGSKDSGHGQDKGCEPARKPPIAYASQPNAWFDQKMTLWWIHEVFWPFHTAQHGNRACVLLLDHCPAHIDLNQVEYDVPLPENLKIVYFPVNMSRRRHPAEGGIIGTLKLAYKLKMVSSVLALFDILGGFHGAQERYYGSGDREAGSGGLACGDPATLLDCLFILNQVWNTTTKYATTTLILEGWKEACLLPSWWEDEISIWIRNGANLRPRRKEGWIDQDCLQLSRTLQSLAVKVDESDLEKHQLESSALKNSYLLLRPESDSFRRDRDEDLWAMATSWIEIEDDALVREHTLDYECDQVLSRRARARELENMYRLHDEQKHGDQALTRYERVQRGLEDARGYAQYLGMDDKILSLLDRFQNKLSQMAKKQQKQEELNVKVGDDRKKRVKLSNGHGEVV